MKRMFVVLGLLIGIALSPGIAALEEYVKAADPAYQWVKSVEQKIPEGTLVEITMVSQKWREFEWKHRLRMVKPETVKHPELAILYITGSGDGREELQRLAKVAAEVGAIAAVLHDIPNQPLIRPELVEDNLIAHTFVQYYETGDETWPLLFPMVKGAVRAMDTLQQFAKEAWQIKIEGFMVTGASKRGWTTWLTAAVDKRVKGIAPIVFDNLNFFAQMPHQIATWGKYSEQIAEYSERNLMQVMNTERGKRLVKMVDPYHYRDRYRLPILIINGANDRYWVTDAARWYFPDLPSKEKYLLYVPNAGHGLGDREQVLNGLTAFYLKLAGEIRFPATFKWSYLQPSQYIVLSLESDLEPEKVLVWVATSPNKDFRDSRWEAVEAKKSAGKWVVQMERQRSGYMALFAEAHYKQREHAFTLCTIPYIVTTPSQYAPAFVE